jgi:RimJ/RimL family protein N-acetyltransferase
VPDTAYPLKTERLVIRLPRAEDVDVLTSYRNDPEVSALQDWELPYPRERAEQLVASHADRTDVIRGGGTQLAITLDGRTIGDIYVGIDEPGGIAEIGFTLAREHQGHGYALEAVSAVVDDLVDRIGVHRIFAQLSKDNAASARLLERLGMTFESLTARSYWWRGTYDDNLTYAMSADERRAWRDRPRDRPEQVRLVPITHENVWTYGKLRTHYSQQRFVAPMWQSYGDALFPEPEQGHPVVPVLLGIEADGEPVGFLMYADAVNEGTPEPYLWRFLVDRLHQGRGIGGQALRIWLDDMRAAGHQAVAVSWEPGHGGPEGFYLKNGFEPTGEIEDGEIVARRVL